MDQVNPAPEKTAPVVSPTPVAAPAVVTAAAKRQAANDAAQAEYDKSVAALGPCPGQAKGEDAATYTKRVADWQAKSDSIREKRNAVVNPPRPTIKPGTHVTYTVGNEVRDGIFLSFDTGPQYSEAEFRPAIIAYLDEDRLDLLKSADWRDAFDRAVGVTHVSEEGYNHKRYEVAADKVVKPTPIPKPPVPQPPTPLPKPTPTPLPIPEKA